MNSCTHFRKPAVWRRGLGAWLVAGLVASGCEDGGTPPPPPPAGSVEIQFDHTVGGDDLRFDSRDYVNAAGNAYSLHDLRYIVSNLELVRLDGSSYRAADVHLRDASQPDSRTWQATGIPDGHYETVRFTFGLDAQHNVPDGLPDTNEYRRMIWPEPLGGGYHFMLLDGFFADSTGATAAWAAHLGRLLSAAQPTPVETAFQVEIPVVLHVAGDAQTVRVVMDVNAWFAAPQVYDFDVYRNANMENPVALRSLHDNGSAHVFGLGAAARARR